MKYNRKEFVGEYDAWRDVTERGELVGTETERWQTATKETTEWGDGRKDVKFKNVQNHSRTTHYYRYYVYDVLYHINNYRHFFKCEVCGNEENDVREELTELERKLKRTYVG